VSATSDTGEIRLLILAAQRHGSRMLAGRLRQVSLTPAQAEVLQVLAEYAPLTLVELGRLLICETGSPSRLVDALVQRDLITRETGDDDKRVVRLHLTHAGKQMLGEARAMLSTVEGHITDRLTSDEMTELAALLRKLLRDTPSEHAIRTRCGQSLPWGEHPS
jgi:DNA-binding MarR family transcriptional regulator